MSNTTEQKTYVPKSSAKEITFERSGKTIMKIGFHAETMIAFLKQHANEKGYVNLGISKRKEVGSHGDTHCIWLDTWQPKLANERPQPMSREQVREGFQKAANVPSETDDGQIPF